MDNGKLLVLATDLSEQGSGLFDNQIPNGFINSAQLAQLLGISIHTVRKWTKFRTIPYRKFGRAVRFHLGDVLGALSKRNGK